MGRVGREGKGWRSGGGMNCDSCLYTVEGEGKGGGVVVVAAFF